MSKIENRPFDVLQVGEEDRLVHTLTPEDFSLLATQAATIGAGLVDPTVAATRAFSIDAAQSGWASALMCALIAGRLPGAGSKLVRQTMETTTPARPGDVMTIVARVMSKAPEGRHVTIGVRATNQHGDLAMSGTAEIVAPKKAIVAEPREEFVEEMHEKGRRYGQLIEATRSMKPLKTAVVHPVDEASLMGAVEAAREELVEPVLVGPEGKIRHAAAAHNIDIAGFRIVSTEHSHAAAARAVAVARSGEVEALMKGALHTDELMHEVVATETGLRTSRRISHVFAIDAHAYPRALFITDAAVNIIPSLMDKRDIVQNAIDLVTALGIVTPRVAILSAVETVSPDIRSTLDAAALCKMADRGQINGGILDGPLGFDNAVSVEAARTKGIVSPVAGQADILVVPDLEAGNMLAKQLVYLADAEMAGIVLGARVPIILTSRAANTIARLGSSAIALILARSRLSRRPSPLGTG
jgi:phosphotransacetylase